MLRLSSGLYGHAALARRRLIEARPAARRRLQGPVISVGNLRVGGSGKTPFTAWLAARLAAAGHRPAVLSRGYRRTAPTDEVVIVSDAVRVRAGVAASGDEPLMLAQMVPGAAVLVCADRYRAGRVAEADLGCTVHILDDGFQHLRLARTVDLVLLDEQDLHDRPLPAGRLREPLAALRSADAILWAGDPGRLGEAAGATGVPSVFGLRRLAGPLQGQDGEVPGPGEPVLALAAIAHPPRFFEELEGSGLEVRARLAFRDHHPYSAEDVERIHEAAAAHGARWVVTTEKDLVRLAPLGPLPFRVASRPLEVSPSEPDVFWRWLAPKLGAAAGAAPPRGATVA